MISNIYYGPTSAELVEAGFDKLSRSKNTHFAYILDYLF